ncbi:MAG: hypothetical protein GY739_07130 [Mesoflavibacter sp.]|nr:hypothetical protein [Mesoflavibacter sp.]
MCNWVLKNNKENPFKLFLYLKLTYPSGKITLNSSEIDVAALTIGCTSRTVKNNLNKIIDFGWIYYDDQFKYYRLVSLDVIRSDYNWDLRRAYSFTFKDLSHLKATLGAVLYTQLYKTYCKRFLKKRKSNVLKSESANKPFTFSCDVKNYAEVSVLSIKNFYGINISKASLLKKEAFKYGLIEVKKQYMKLKREQVYATKKSLKYREQSQNIIFKDGSYHLQLIDKIYSNLYFKRRKNLETL